MKMIFFSPFRTSFNLNSLKAWSNEQALNDTLLCLKDLNLKNIKIEVLTSYTTLNELRYTTLNDDNLPSTAKALFTLTIKKQYGLPKVTLHYYDNTIAILEFEMELCSLNKIFFEKIDCSSKKISQHLLKKINRIEDTIYSKLTETDVFLKKNKFYVFFDRKENEVKSILWVTRVLLLDGEFIKNHSTSNILITRWVQQSDLTPKIVGNISASIFVGNSIIHSKLDDGCKESLIRSILFSTYFYVLNDVYNKNLRLLFLQLTSIVLTTKKYKYLVSKINKVQNHIDFIKNEFDDSLIGLQGNTKQLVILFHQVWDYSIMQESVKRKQESINNVVNRITLEKQSKYNRVVESILTAIGGVALLDFSLNLFSYSQKPHKEDSTVGLINVVNYLSLNMTLYSIAAVLLLVVYLVFKRK